MLKVPISSLAHDAPFSNSTPTSRFESERDSGSCSPIFKTKTNSVREKVHLSFSVCRFSRSSIDFQKICFENGLHTKKARFCCIFKFRGIVLILVQLSSC